MIINHPEVRLSLLGVVPQHERRPRIICDYSFHGINEDLEPTGPGEAMRFGRALRRMITQITRANPRFGPLLLGKSDLADGYYRIPLNTDQAIQLACLLPKSPGEEPLAAIPLVLPMGWKESPPYFCAATETIVDITNASLNQIEKHPPHRLEHYISIEYEPHPTELDPKIPRAWRNQLYSTPLANTDVYIDDIIGLCQPAAMPPIQFVRHIFRNIDRVFSLQTFGTQRPKVEKRTNTHKSF
jgi:hypothetical protein